MSAISSALNTLATRLNTLNTSVSNGYDGIIASIVTLGNNQGTYFTALNGFLSGISDTLDDISDYNDDIYTVLSRIDNYLRNDYRIQLDNISSTITGSIGSFHSEWFQWFNNFLGMFDNYFRILADYLDISYEMEFNNEGWLSSFSHSLSYTLHELLLQVNQEIEDQVNPLSTNNIEVFNTATTNLKQQTFIGGAMTIVEAVPTVLSCFSGNTPQSHIYVDTLPVSFAGTTISARTIDIDLSWYAPYRQQAFVVIRAFMIIGWVIIFAKRFPALVSGMPMDLIAEAPSDTPSVSEQITVDDDGVVIGHQTVTRSKGVTTRQIHRY